MLVATTEADLAQLQGLEQAAGPPRVLGEDQGALGEDLTQAWARVAEVADGRGGDVEPPGLRRRRLVARVAQGYWPFASLTAAVSAGTSSKRSPTMPT
ncbi:MAG: hypothetical protein AAF533_23495 [Acidobacteriota bacterium]